ncbi:unnamed protein product [Aureobasidium vineae]|uniref:Uncharacterized protein n=1 Tax=Aureobasidium vineae TaxID=2773715 RepID=A0A9N8JDM9_9PEZI|nr:unnamed protein product [Aureobasidium vineae]
MPPKSTLTQRDVEIDWDKLAAKVGYKNAQSARACFQETKKRMRAMNDNADDENTKKPVISTPETEEDVHNAKAIAAGRARYAADKLAAEVKKEVDDEEPLGMNIDSGEDEGLIAYELVKNEVFGEGVEV